MDNIKIIQTKAIQTILDQEGRLSHYRLTLPVTEEFASTIESKFIVYGKNKVRYFVYQHKDFDQIKRTMLNAQIRANGLKIAQLQRKHIRLNNNLAGL
jgi:hypothetical protein